MAVLNVSYSVASGTTTVRGGLGSAVVAPFIITAPAAQTVIAGGTATFTVVAGGDAPLTYHWQLKPSGGSFANISGATASSYTTPALVSGDNASEYRVVVSGPGGSPATSAAAVLTVQSNAAPVGVGIDPQYTRPLTGNYLWFRAAREPGSGYERLQYHTTLDGSVSATHTIAAHKNGSGVSGTSQTLIVRNQAGTTVATVGPTTTTVGQTSWTWTLNVSTFPQGWYVLDMQTNGPETVLPHPVFVKQEAGATITSNPALMPSWSSSFEISQAGMLNSFFLAWVPAVYAPTEQPQLPRTFTESAAAQTKSTIFGRTRIPNADNETRRPSITKNGILTTANQQSYHIHLQHAKFPAIHILDGPRGRAAMGMLTHIQPAEAAPNGVRRNTDYVFGPWSMFKVTADGTVQTLAGYRHKGVAPYWQDVALTTAAVPPNPANPPGTLELVGDWSAIPSGRHGFQSIWGFAWDTRTTVIDTGAPFQPTDEGPEQPHPADVVGFIADTINNRIVKIAFDGQDRTQPARLSEFITSAQFGNAANGLPADPWDVVFNSATNTIYVSLRRKHQINEYSADTGAFIRTVVQGQDLGTVAPGRTTYLYAGPGWDDLTKIFTAAGNAARAADAVVPEGLFLQDGWLYYSSYICGQVKRVNVTTGVIEVAAQYTPDGGEHYSKIALSDGTFMPRGTIFLSGWNQGHSGWPRVFNPNGTRNQSLLWDLYDALANGRIGGKLSGLGNYSSTCGVGYGRLLVSPSTEGLFELSAVKPEDPPAFNDALLKTNPFKRTGQSLMWRGLGWYGLPAPWGQHAATDEMLRSLDFSPPPTAITEQPQNDTVNAGEAAQFTVRAYGAGLSYQPQVSSNGGSTWANAGGLLPIGNSATYTTPILVAGDNGKQYRFIVTGTNGTVNSDAATVTVNP